MLAITIVASARLMPMLRIVSFMRSFCCAKAAVEMGRIGAGMAPDFLEVDRAGTTGIGGKTVEPAAEAQVTHAAAVIAARAEGDSATVNGSVGHSFPDPGSAEADHLHRDRHRDDADGDEEGHAPLPLLRVDGPDP